MYNISLSKVLGSSDLTRSGGIFYFKKMWLNCIIGLVIYLSVVSNGLDIFNLNWSTIVC